MVEALGARRTRPGALAPEKFPDSGSVLTSSVGADGSIRSGRQLTRCSSARGRLLHVTSRYTRVMIGHDFYERNTPRKGTPVGGFPAYGGHFFGGAGCELGVGKMSDRPANVFEIVRGIY